MIAGFTDLSPESTIRMLLSVFYFMCGALKMFNIEGFYFLIKHYRMLSELNAELISYLLPPLEIILGILLFTKSYPLIVLLFATLLQLIFVLFTLIARIKRGGIKNCAILGNAIEIKLSWLIVIFNAIILFLTGYLFFRTIFGLSL